MNKKDLDALAGLYEGVYSSADCGEYFTEEFLGEQGGQRGSSSASQTNQSVSGAQLLYGPSGRPQSPSSRPTNVRGGGTRASRPTAAPTQSRFAGARDAAFAKARQIKGSPVVGPKPTEKPAATRPAATLPAAKPATPASGAKVAPTAAKPAPGTKAAGPDSIKPKTPNPLMQRTFGYQTGNAPDQIKAASAGADPKKAEASFARSKQTANKLGMSGSLKAISSGYEWPSAKTIRDIAGAYASIYEAKKKDQDQDGDNDFADVRIARMMASGMSKAEAIAAVKNKEYNEEFEFWVDSLVEEGYDLSDYTWDEMFDIYLDEGEKPLPYGRMMRKSDELADSDDKKKRRRAAKIYLAANAPKGPKVKVRGGLDEATRMRKELGKEGEIATRKELAARSKAYKRSGSVDRTIAAAERGADRPYIKHKRDESDSDRKKREERQSRTLRGLAASRKGSVRDKPRVQLRGYAAKVEGSDKDLQRARSSAMSAGTLTPKEKKQLGEEYAIYEIIASYLLENNFAETLNDANIIIENMSENWVAQILESFE